MSPVPSRGARGRLLPKGSPNLQNIPTPADVAVRLIDLINPTKPQPEPPAPKRLVNRIALVLDRSIFRRVGRACRSDLVKTMSRLPAPIGHQLPLTSMQTMGHPIAEVGGCGPV